MRSSSRLVAVVAALALTAGVCAVPSSAAPVPAAAVGKGAGVRVVELLTGDSVVISTDRGRTRMAFRPVSGRNGVAAASTMLRLGATTYAIPAVARRYVGSILDMSLFAVDAARPARLPVELTLNSATSSPAVPGLVITSRTGTGARGYLDAGQARAFGDALARQWRADTAAHRGPTSILGGLRHLVLVGTRAPVQPAFPQVTLVLKGIDPHGRPADGVFVVLVNVDDGRKYVGAADLVNGQARVSVPKGHYSLEAEFDDMIGTRFVSDLVPVADFAVTTDKQAYVIDARKATVVPSVATPRTADAQFLQLEWDRGTALASVGYGAGFDPQTLVKVAPTEPSPYGTTDWLTQWTLAATPTSGTPYTYDLSFHDSDVVPADQSRTVSPLALTTVRARYFSDGRVGAGEFSRIPLYPFQFVGFGLFFPLPAPSARTEYVYNSAGAQWFSTYLTPSQTGDVFDATFVDDPGRIYQPGSTTTADWLDGALTPGVPRRLDPDGNFACYTCRTDTQLSVALFPVTDSDPGHLGFTVAEPRFRAWRDGTSLFDQRGFFGADLTVPKSAATYRIREDVDNASTGALLSTTVSTDVTFRSAAGQGAPLPDGSFCDFTDPCRVLPVLTARVPLPTGLDGTAPPGPTTIDFTVQHVLGATDSALTGVHFLYAVNGGAYVASPVARVSAHEYRAVVNAPRGSVVSTRVVADDAEGGHLVQTAADAYRVATN